MCHNVNKYIPSAFIRKKKKLTAEFKRFSGTNQMILGFFSRINVPVRKKKTEKKNLCMQLAFIC